MDPLALTPSTELDAVNVCLSVIGESPINTLVGSQNALAASAQGIIREISRRVQSEGWAFNREDNVELAPNTNGYIIVPLGTLRVDADDVDVVQRGPRLYNRAEHTFVFTEPVRVSITYGFSFDDLPQAAKDYIAIRAARTMHARTLGSSTIASLTVQDEEAARVVLLQYEEETNDSSMLDGFSTFRPSGVLNRVPYFRGY